MDPKSNEYARVDKAAAWMLLAKIYLNAEVYTKTARYDKAVEYSDKAVNSGYTLDPVYQNIFLADNHNSPEVIFPVAFDGLSTQTWGGTTFIIHAAVGGDMSPGDYGIDGGWGGTRTTSGLVNKFPDVTGDTDSRAMFFTEGQTLEIIDIGNFNDGYAVEKFKNLTTGGSTGSHLTYPDTDFPMFRLADAYLMYAEAVKRGGGGSEATALELVNALRTRAFSGSTDGNISAGDLTLDFILDERARELYWECHRRTDLVRYNKFTGGDYLWPWKGNAAVGTATDSKFDIFPIPDSDVNANSNLVQNPGY
jgi:hypothetical protein